MPLPVGTIPPLSDTVAGAQMPAPFNAALDSAGIARLEQLCPADTAVITATEAAAPPAWLDGIEGQRRERSSGSDSGLLTVLTLLFVALALNFKHCPRIFANFFGEMLSVRRRANVFDEHTTNETRVLILLIVQYVAYLGILLYALIDLDHPMPPDNIFGPAMMLMGLVGAYYLFQLCAYNFVGYVFSTPDGRRQWLRGFNATQSLAGLVLMIPALLTLFYPHWARITLIVAAGVYVIARFLFIIKGFRIFFTRFSSLVYFILYLCSLEIIPIIIIYQISLYLVSLSPISI